MQIEINDQRKIFAIQEEFNQVFPNLKIQFYERGNTKEGGPGRQLVKSRGKTLLDCRVMHDAGPITIDPQMTYGELKQHFEDSYGLSIHLSQNSARNAPVGTPVIESATLETLNNGAEV
jgi:hypothetical protein